MPQLPPVAAAAFVIAVLMAILVTTVTVQVRARRRRTLLAAMLRATAPVPDPIPVPVPRSAASSAGSSATTTTLEAPIAATPSPPSSLRGNDYSRAEREARFSAFDERSSTREAAPGRPARRLAAQVAHAAAATAPVLVAGPERPMSVAPAAEAPRPAPATAPIERVEPPQAPSTPVRHIPMRTHGGLASVILDVDVPTAIAPSMPVVAPVPVAVVEVAVEEPVVAEREPEQASPVETPPAPPRTPELLREAIRESVREPQMTVLAPRQVVPALPALMTREVTLGDAARALRNSLTMTDGRQLRRAVAVGAATSVVAAAFAIRGRKR